VCCRSSHRIEARNEPFVYIHIAMRRYKMRSLPGRSSTMELSPHPLDLPRPAGGAEEDDPGGLKAAPAAEASEMLLKEGGLGGVYRAAAYVAHDVITSPGGQSFSSLSRYPKAIFLARPRGT